MEEAKPQSNLYFHKNKLVPNKNLFRYGKSQFRNATKIDKNP